VAPGVGDERGRAGVVEGLTQDRRPHLGVAQACHPLGERQVGQARVRSVEHEGVGAGLQPEQHRRRPTTDLRDDVGAGGVRLTDQIEDRAPMVGTHVVLPGAERDAAPGGARQLRHPRQLGLGIDHVARQLEDARGPGRPARTVAIRRCQGPADADQLLR
jgi:hypothetical protein